MLSALQLAQVSWVGLMILTLGWDGIYTPLQTSWILVVIKLLPLILPIRGILSGRIYTYQYCSMLIMLYFAESVMRLWDLSFWSRALASIELILCVLFFVCCLKYLNHFKK